LRWNGARNRPGPPFYKLGAIALEPLAPPERLTILSRLTGHPAEKEGGAGAVMHLDQYWSLLEYDPIALAVLVIGFVLISALVVIL
jgi:hypothetical protein